MSQAGHDRTIEELVARAKTYPFPRHPGSFVFTHGRLYPVPHPSGPWSPELEIADGDRTITFAELCERVAAETGTGRAGAHPDAGDYACAERTPVFGYSSNASPEALSHKFAMLPHAVIPSIRCRVIDWDAVYSCHVSRGYIPGAIHPSPGTELHGTMSWLTDEELEMMNASESLGTNYEFRPLKGAVATFETGESIVSPWVYFTLHGELRINDLPIAVEGTIADNRRYGVMKETEILELAHSQLAPDQDLDTMIASAIESFETQQALSAKLKDCHFTTPGGTRITDHRVTLDDGRTLAYAQYGDPSGRPLIYHHGGVSCALDIAFADGWCGQNGVRLIAPDRPGIRASSPHPGYGLADTAADTAALADRLEVERFAVSGWSAGGPHAIACAAMLGERIDAVATVGSTAPRSEAKPGLAVDRFLYPTARRAKPAARAFIAAASRMSPKTRERRTRRAVRCEADRRIIDSLPAGTISSWMDGTTSQGPRGVLDDYLSTGYNWSTTARQASRRVHLFQGSEDHLVPPVHAERLAALLPDAEVRLIEGSGHFLLYEHLAQVVSALGLGRS